MIDKGRSILKSLNISISCYDYELIDLRNTISEFSEGSKMESHKSFYS